MPSASTNFPKPASNTLSAVITYIVLLGHFWKRVTLTSYAASPELATTIRIIGENADAFTTSFPTSTAFKTRQPQSIPVRFTPTNGDYQDYVFLLSNVVPVD